MTVEELDVNERRAFLVWRRNLARLVLSYTLLCLYLSLIDRMRIVQPITCLETVL
jgi:hypothetical protein